MKILIILNESYPIGMACTKRIHLYAKGLTKLGNNVKVIIPKPTEKYNNVKNHETSGEFDSVHYQYAWKTTTRSKSFLERRMHDFFSLNNMIFLCLKQKPKIILFTGNSTYIYILLKLSCILINAKLVRERSEVPYYKKDHLNFFDKLKIKVSYSFLDGIIAISDNLIDFFKTEISIKTKIIKIPILVDNKPENIENSNIYNNLVYTGSLTQKKDGVLTIIKSFVEISKKYNSLKLIMTGNINSSANKDEILNLIKEYSLEDKVILTGFITDKELLELTKNAKVLLLAKPANRQNKYNAATKIGEYLLTGRPVLITNVDATCTYLENRKSAFIVEPDEKSFSTELEYIINHPEHANSIGEKGRLIAIRKFNYLKQTENINNFFKSI